VQRQGREYWAKLIAEQEASGMTVRAFCGQRGIADHCLYYWRKRLNSKQPVKFALVKTIPMTASSIELFLPGGERLCIPRGVDGATLRCVLAALRS
jgi:transposase-like protein